MDVAQAAEALGHVKAVPDVELVRHGEADVPDGQVVDEPAVRAVEQRAHGDVARIPEEQRLHHVVEGEARVDDVLDQHEVAPPDRQVEILDEADA